MEPPAERSRETPRRPAITTEPPHFSTKNEGAMIESRPAESRRPRKSPPLCLCGEVFPDAATAFAHRETNALGRPGPAPAGKVYAGSGFGKGRASAVPQPATSKRGFSR